METCIPINIQFDGELCDTKCAKRFVRTFWHKEPRARPWGGDRWVRWRINTCGVFNQDVELSNNGQDFERCIACLRVETTPGVAMGEMCGKTCPQCGAENMSCGSYLHEIVGLIMSAKCIARQLETMTAKAESLQRQVEAAETRLEQVITTAEAANREYSRNYNGCVGQLAQARAAVEAWKAWAADKCARHVTDIGYHFCGCDGCKADRCPRQTHPLPEVK